MKESAEQHRAVFLHAGWRCASTYVWSRFRRNPYTTSFYEPFGESLARCSPKRIQRQTAQGWNSRHPPLALPYADEYRPLLHPLLRGMPGYRSEFALERYFPTAAGIGPEARYVSRLIRHAQRHGTQAVLGFSRSLGRAAALKHALGGYHVLVRRNPLQQWLSCRSYREQTSLSYFELCHFLILALAPACTPARRFATMLGLPRRLPRSLPQQLRFIHEAVQPCSDELSYRAFTAVSLLSHAVAEPITDLVLDVDRLGRSPRYREGIRARILADVGLSIDFDDCRVPTHDPALVRVDFAAIERDVRLRLLSCEADLALIPARAIAIGE
ncbi:MAG TPA: hypothetical protein VN735_00430 [Steroidobacteraceae bacterium]|nr:hypothetical protein [Steroidobacteraceae bacterium]